MTNGQTVLLPLLMLFTGVLFQDYLQYFFNIYMKDPQPPNVLFTAETLARFNGVTENKLYMAVLGVVYDVSEGPQHYAKGSPYHYFVGKDGSKALVTGDFQNESDDKDHVLDLACPDFLSLMQWRENLKKKYKKVGFVAGRYYESNGKGTAYMLEVEERIKMCIKEKESAKKQDLKYPPCNVAWSETEGTKVWCSKTSGGVTRDWVGVPRQLFTPGEQMPKCVCLNTNVKQDTFLMFKEYDNCENTSAVCFVDSG